MPREATITIWRKAAARQLSVVSCPGYPRVFPHWKTSGVNIWKARPRDSFVAGLSMGGFGAFKLALNQPESVAAAGSFSGTVDILGRLAMQRGSREEFRRIFGSPDQVGKSLNDLPWLVSRDREAAWPRLFQCCGTEDPFLEINRNFRNAARDHHVPLTYVEDAGYGHTWDYWDLKIQSFLEWLDGLDLGKPGNPDDLGKPGNLSR